jgi:hypothetical protein
MRISEPWGACLTGPVGAARRPGAAACSEGTGSGSAAHPVAAAVVTNAGTQLESLRTWPSAASNVPYWLTLPGPDWPLSRRPLLVVAEVHS